MLDLWKTLVIGGFLGVFTAGVVTVVNFVVGIVLLIRILHLLSKAPREYHFPVVQLAIHLSEVFVTTGLVLLVTNSSLATAISFLPENTWMLMAPMVMLLTPFVNLFSTPRNFRNYYLWLVVWSVVRFASLLAVWATVYEMARPGRQDIYGGHIGWVWLFGAFLLLSNLLWVEQQRKAILYNFSQRVTTSPSENGETRSSRNSDMGRLSRKRTTILFWLLVGVLATLEGTRSFQIERLQDIHHLTTITAQLRRPDDQLLGMTEACNLKSGVCERSFVFTTSAIQTEVEAAVDALLSNGQLSPKYGRRLEPRQRSDDGLLYEMRRLRDHFLEAQLPGEISIRSWEWNADDREGRWIYITLYNTNDSANNLTLDGIPLSRNILIVSHHY